MPPFPKPDFSYEYRISSQINALREYMETKPGALSPELLRGGWHAHELP